MSDDIVSLGEAYPKEQARCRAVLGSYREIGPAGALGAMFIEDMLQRADRAVAKGDVVEMLRLYDEMRGTK